ncbi:hypothetical protein Hanom_Chr03g00237691 [Helianthus anomalus]
MTLVYNKETWLLMPPRDFFCTVRMSLTELVVCGVLENQKAKSTIIARAVCKLSYKI